MMRQEAVSEMPETCQCHHATVRAVRASGAGREATVYGKNGHCIRQRRPLYAANEASLCGTRDLFIRDDVTVQMVAVRAAGAG